MFVGFWFLAWHGYGCMVFTRLVGFGCDSCGWMDIGCRAELVCFVW